MKLEKHYDGLLRNVVQALVHDEQPPEARKQLRGWRLTVLEAMLDAHAGGGAEEVRSKCRMLVANSPHIAAVLEGIPLDEIPEAIGAADLMGGAGRALRWAVPGLVPEGLTILAGAPKMGKSWLCLELAVAIASGSTALGSITTDPGDVLYLALEDTDRRLRERLLKILGNRPLPERLHFVSNDQHVPRWERGGKFFLERWLDAHPQTRLVIVDTLVKFRPQEQAGLGTYERDYHGMEDMLRLAGRRRIALVLVHHTRKMEARDAMQTISGSFGLTGGVDGMLLLQRERGQVDAVLLVTGRDVEEQAYALQWNSAATGWQMIGSATEVQLSTARRAILEVLDVEARPMTPKEVWEVLESDDPTTKRAAVRQLMLKMSREEVLVVEEGNYRVALLDAEREEGQVIAE